MLALIQEITMLSQLKNSNSDFIKELYLLQRNLKGTFNASWHRNNINHKRIPHAKFKSDIDSLTFSGVSC
jgi:hypothetical protein